jgi:hypothetical protein
MCEKWSKFHKIITNNEYQKNPHSREGSFEIVPKIYYNKSRKAILQEKNESRKEKFFDRYGRCPDPREKVDPGRR